MSTSASAHLRAELIATNIFQIIYYMFDELCLMTSKRS